MAFKITNPVFTKIDALNLDVLTLNTRVSHQDDRLNTYDHENLTGIYSGKIVSFLGDSLTTFAGYIPSANRARYPEDDLLQVVDDTWWKRIVNQFGFRLGINESWAGSRISWDGTTESADIGANKHIASVARISNLKNSGNPDVIVVWGGTNDIAGAVTLGTFSSSTATYTLSNTVDTYANACRTMFYRLMTSYPRARIYCVLPCYSTMYTSSSLDTYNNMLRDICDFFKVTYIDLRLLPIGQNRYMKILPDGTHPNAIGMKMISDFVYKSMLNNMYQSPYTTYEGDNTDDITYYPVYTTNLKSTDNLFTYLRTKTYYYDGSKTWVNALTGTYPLLSVCFKVKAGDRLVADSFGTAVSTGAGLDGIRVTFLKDGVVILSSAPASVFAEYTSKGYITVPDNVNEVNLPFWDVNFRNKHTVYNLSLRST